jgi:hypothetical protein
MVLQTREAQGLFTEARSRMIYGLARSSGHKMRAQEMATSGRRMVATVRAVSSCVQRRLHGCLCAVGRLGAASGECVRLRR